MIKRFIDFWNDKPSSQEARLAAAYKNSVAEQERLQTALLEHLRPQKTGKGLIAVFTPAAEEIVLPLEGTEKHLNEVEADINQFLALTNGESSTERLAKDKQRFQTAINNQKFAVKNAILRQVRRGAASEQEAEGSAEVQAALAKQDKVLGTYEPQLKDVEARLGKIRAILAKY